MKNSILLLILDLFSIGGIEKYTRSLCRSLAGALSQVDFTALSLYDSAAQCDPLPNNIHFVTCENIKVRFFKKIYFALKAARLAISTKPKLIICTHINVAIVGSLLKRCLGIEYAVITHGIDVWETKKGMRYRSMQSAKIIICASQYTKKRLIENGIAEDKIKLLTNAVDTAYFRPRPVNPELAQRLEIGNRCVLLTVGRVSSLERYKGHDVMLEVMRTLDNSYVWLVVGDGDDLPRLKEKANDLGLAKKVIFAGKVDDRQLLEYYNLCSMFVMPSTREGFGIVFLEALACGKPVVGGNRDGSIEPLGNGDLGFMVEAGNADEISRTIQHIRSLPDKRTDPGYLRQEVEKRFGTQVFTRQAQEIFSDIVR